MLQTLNHRKGLHSGQLMCTKVYSNIETPHLMYYIRRIVVKSSGEGGDFSDCLRVAGSPSLSATLAAIHTLFGGFTNQCWL